MIILCINPLTYFTECYVQCCLQTATARIGLSRLPCTHYWTSELHDIEPVQYHPSIEFQVSCLSWFGCKISSGCTAAGAVDAVASDNAAVSSSHLMAVANSTDCNAWTVVVSQVHLRWKVSCLSVSTCSLFVHCSSELTEGMEMVQVTPL